MSSKIYRVIDGGGNGFRRADFINGNLFSHKKIKPTTSYVELVDFICGDMLPNCQGVGISVAGIIQNGIVVQSPNIPFLNEVNLAGLIISACKKKVIVVNDMDAAGMGMYALRLRNTDISVVDEPFLALTVSSGIGGRIIVGGEVINSGAEMSHFVIDTSSDAPKCPCGLRGCVESLAGGEASTKLVSLLKQSSIPSGMHPLAYLDQEFDCGEKWAKVVYNQVALALAQFFATIMTTSVANLHTVVYKGTFGKYAFPRIEGQIRSYMEIFLMQGMRERAKSLLFIPCPDMENDAFYGLAELLCRAIK